MEIQSKGGEGRPIQCMPSFHVLALPPMTLPEKPTTSQVQGGGGEKKEIHQKLFFFFCFH